MADTDSVLSWLWGGVSPQEAIPFGAGTTPQGDPTLISNAAQRIGGALALPGEVYQGNVDPMSEQGIQAATDFGSHIVGSPISAPEEGFILGSGRVTRRPALPADNPMTPAQQYQRYRQLTEESRIRDKEANAAIRATRDQPVPDFQHDNTAIIDALIGKEQSGMISQPELGQLKNLLWERYR